MLACPQRMLLPLVAVALLVPITGCHDDTPTRPITIATPSPVHGVIAQAAFSGFATDIWISIELLLSQKGKLDITVDWTYPETWMYVYFGKTRCSYDELAYKSCPFLISSETKDPKPRVLFTDELEPGSYYLVLYNVPYWRARGIGSHTVEAVAIQVGLTVNPSGQRVEVPIRLGRPITVAPPRL
jgi:hypothetical protein